MEHYKAIVIGSGQAGNPLARKLAENGWKTALVEKRKVGGTCINDGCTPTKAMVASAKLAYMSRKSYDWGIAIDNPRVDMEEVINRKERIVNSFRTSTEKSLHETENLDLIYGEASFSEDKILSIVSGKGTSQFSADFIFINTGTRPAVPKIGGLEDAGYLTSTTLLELKEIPNHLMILGGGPVALEFAQMYRRFGSKVTIVEQNKTILSFEDEDVAKEITNIFEEDGIVIVTGAKIEKLRRENNAIMLEVVKNGKKEQLRCSHLLLAAGRVPNTDQLGLEQAAIKTDENGYIEVNDKLETSASGIYALGDVKGGPAFTHVSFNDHLVVAENLLKKGNLSIKDRLVPYCVFIDPQLARVGISEREARENHMDIKVAKMPMKNVARAIETGETRGFMKVIVENATKKILGAAILGSEGGEIMAVLQMAMMGGITYDKIRDGIFAHPTYVESLNNLFLALE